MGSRTLLALILAGVFVFGFGPTANAADTVVLKSVHLGELENGEKDRFLAAHNAARKMVQVAPVAWSNELSQYAREWLGEQQAGVIEKAKEGWDQWLIGIPEHRKEAQYGENIAAWVGTNADSAERAVTMWLREKKVFDELNAPRTYKFGDEQGKTQIDEKGKERPLIVGHYTAIVWKDTTHIGAAKLVFELTNEQGMVRKYVAVICNYDPPGNRHGDKVY